MEAQNYYLLMGLSGLLCGFLFAMAMIISFK